MKIKNTRFYVLAGCAAIIVAIAFMAPNTSIRNQGCGLGEHYDPTHQICQPYLPANPQPGYPGFGGGPNGYYDPSHGVEQPYPPAYPPPFYGPNGW